MNYQKKNSIDKKISKYSIYVLSILTIFILWILANTFYNNSLVIPSVKGVFQSLGQLLSGFRIYSILFSMILKILFTTFVSLIVALIMSIISFRFKGFSYYLSPMIVIVKTMPIIAIIILLFMSVGIKSAPYIATSFVLIPIMYESILNTLLHIDKSITDDLKTVVDINILVIIKFYIPLIFPSLITSVIQSFGLGIKVMLMSEFISPASNTFGSEIRRYYENLDMEKVYSLVILVLVIVLIVDGILKFFREKWYNNID